MSRLSSGMRRFVVLGINSSAVKNMNKGKNTAIHITMHSTKNMNNRLFGSKHTLINSKTNGTIHF
jgi:hypothetical protein